MNPAELGIEESDQLGEWDLSYYDELLYLQSGVYTYRQDDKWKTKYRGLDAGTITPETVISYMQYAQPNESNWPTIDGQTTRFIGYRAALQRALDETGTCMQYHRQWLKAPKSLKVGNTGKRVHRPAHCHACSLNATPYEMPHDYTINSLSVMRPMSTMHEIPWEDNLTSADWRAVKNVERSLIA